MTMKKTKTDYEVRINLLKNRKADNSRIIRKLERKLRRAES